MKKLLFLVAFFLCTFLANATTYYFSSSGNDSYSSSQATNPATPWKSISKFNSICSSLKPGDAVLFKRGDKFYGNLIISKSGTSSNRIVIGAYGSGAKPIITGFVTVSGWKSIGSGKYETTISGLEENGIELLTMGGNIMPKGRYPNSDAANGGWLNFESVSTSKKSITDKELTSATNWKGAEIAVRSKRYVIDISTITSHSGRTLSFSPALSYPSEAGFGYFIQNHIKTLDKTGEWCYNASTKKLTMYFGSLSPSSTPVQIPALLELVTLRSQDYVTITDLALSGAAKQGVDIYSGDNIIVKNTDVSHVGVDAILAANTNNLLIEGNTITHAYNTGVNLTYNCNKSLVKGNTISKTSTFPSAASGANKGIGIKEVGKYNVIEGNRVLETGYIGIRFSGDYAEVRNNLVDRFNTVKDDGGGIYTNSTLGTKRVGQKVIGNIVLNGVGAGAGTVTGASKSTTGIYLDDWAMNIEVSGNTVASCPKTGIYVHNNQNITVTGNTLYNNGSQIVMVHDKVPTSPLRNITIKNNIMVSKTASQEVLTIGTILNDIALMGSMDNNYYARPVDDGYVIGLSFVNSKGVKVGQTLDLAGWKALYKKDLSSKTSAVSILPHQLLSLKGSNFFPNPDFVSNIAGLVVTSSTSSHSKDWISKKLDAGTFQGIIKSSTTSSYITSYNIGAVTAGKKYIVQFMAQASKDTLLNLMMRTSGAPYRILSNDGQKNYIKLTKTAKMYELVMVPRESSSSTVLIWETFGASKFTVWYDKIRIQEVNAMVTDPTDSIKLVYNASSAAKTTALDGSYMDITGKTYNGSINLDPYKSAVLVKKGKATPSETPSKVAPTVKITSPTATTYASTSKIQLKATASDGDGSISKVEFYNGTKLIITEKIAPYDIEWEGVLPGTYTITAKAYDNQGNTTTSAPVKFTLNAAPKVTITSPKASTKFTTSSSIKMTATATDADGKINRVEFYNGTKLIATEKNAPYAIEWKGATSNGTYTITTKAYDDFGEAKTSSAVSFSVSGGKSSVAKSATASSLGIQEGTLAATGADSIQKQLQPTTIGFNVYPNPAVSKIFVSYNQEQIGQRRQLMIRNVSGSLVKSIQVSGSENVTEVDLSGLSSGVYMLTVIDEQSVSNTKFIKQ